VEKISDRQEMSQFYGMDFLLTFNSNYGSALYCCDVLFRKICDV